MPIPIDTVYITEIYLQRPVQFSTWSLGRWFNYCHELKDKDLVNSASSMLTKKIIVEKGYNMLSYFPLIQVNTKAGGK